jgi:C4-type Zn-finger protein
MTGTAALDVWEAGLTMTPAARALLLLDAAGHLDAGGWPIGRRDQTLVRAYLAANRSLAAVADCPACGEQLDLDLDPSELGTAYVAEVPVTVECDGYRVVARLPTGADLVRLPVSESPDVLRAELLGRCVVSAEQAGTAVEPSMLPESVVVAVESALEQADPGADVQLVMSCAACGAEWPESFDVVRFVWTSVESAARRLAIDVHVLAQAYGWAEAEILGLSSFRRHLYLSAVEQ